MVLGPFPLNVRSCAQIPSEVWGKLEPGDNALGLIRETDPKGNKWFRHEKGWSMKRDAEQTNHARSNKYGMLFLARKSKKPHRRVLKDGAVYYKPLVNASPSGTVRAHSQVAVTAKYRDDNGKKWYRTDEGWLSEDMCTLNT